MTNIPSSRKYHLDFQELSSTLFTYLFIYVCPKMYKIHFSFTFTGWPQNVNQDGYQACGSTWTWGLAWGPRVTDQAAPLLQRTSPGFHPGSAPSGPAEGCGCATVYCWWPIQKRNHPGPCRVSTYLVSWGVVSQCRSWIHELARIVVRSLSPTFPVLWGIDRR